jgi:RAT1-interacting protein
MQSFKTIQIPRLVRNKPGAWDPVLCLDWGHRFLMFLNDAIRGTPPSEDTRVWRVKFTPNAGVSIVLLDQDAVKDVEGGEDRVGILPRWYLDSKVMSES